MKFQTTAEQSHRSILFVVRVCLDFFSHLLLSVGAGPRGSCCWAQSLLLLQTLHNTNRVFLLFAIVWNQWNTFRDINMDIIDAMRSYVDKIINDAALSGNVKYNILRFLDYDNKAMTLL